jgi:isopenicillin-N N-acyltransferase-like protein
LADGAHTTDAVRYGALVAESLERIAPDLVAEIEGIAAGAGQSTEELLAINARTELLASQSGRERRAGAHPGGKPECSVIGLLPEASREQTCVLAQNWDYVPALTPSRVIWSVLEPPEHWFTTMTEAGILAKIGLNSRRLACCISGMDSTADGTGNLVSSLPMHVILRLTLERCDNLTDALRLAMNVSVAASFCVTCGYADDSGGLAASVELSPGGGRILWPNTSGYIAHANHFLRRPHVGEDCAPREAPGSLVRLEVIERQLRARLPSVSLEDVQDILRNEFNSPDAICNTNAAGPARWVERLTSPAGEVRDSNTSTLMSIVMDLTNRSVWASDGPPSAAPYESIPLPKRDGLERASDPENAEPASVAPHTSPDHGTAV